MCAGAFAMDLIHPRLLQDSYHPQNKPITWNSPLHSLSGFYNSVAMPICRVKVDFEGGDFSVSL